MGNFLGYNPSLRSVFYSCNINMQVSLRKISENNWLLTACSNKHSANYQGYLPNYLEHRIALPSNRATLKRTTLKPCYTQTR